MKFGMKRILVLLSIMCILLSSIGSGLALSSSLSVTTGITTCKVLKTYKKYNGGRNRGYIKTAEDIYVSEKVITDKWVKDVTLPNSTDTLDKLTYSESSTISATGNLDIVKILGFKTSITVASASSAGASHKVDKKKGKYACLAIKCDYIEVTYKHYTYNSRGKTTGCETRKVLIPIPGSAVYYVRYLN